MSQVNMVFTMLFEKRSKICPLPKNDDVLAGKKSQAGWGGAWGWRGRLHQPSSCEEGHKGRGRHPEVFNSTPVIPIVAG